MRWRQRECVQNNLEEARTQIDAIAWYINDQIKEHEHSLMMIYIQKSLQGRCAATPSFPQVPVPLFAEFDAAWSQTMQNKF
jgi:hypothetical protein